MSTSSCNSTSSTDIFQNSVYVGINIENILYGMELLLYFRTIHIVLSNKKRRKSDNFYALFSTIMVFLITVWVATQAIFGEKMWLLNPNFPGGPDAYWQKHIADWYMDWGTTAVILLQLMTDSLMIYRCRIIWNSYRVIIIPVLLWLATLCLGSLVDWISSAPGGNFFAGMASQLAFAYYTVSVSLNAILTCMICYRLLRQGRTTQQLIGRAHASLYYTLVRVVVESVLPCTVSGIAFLVSFGMGSPTSIAFVSVYVLLMCISPQILILRVILDKPPEVDSSRTLTVRISNLGNTSNGTQRFDSTGARIHLQTLSNVYYRPDGRDKV